MGASRTNEETGLQARTRPSDLTFLLLALLGPIFLLLGFLTRGLALFYADYPRLIFICLVLAMSAVAAAFLALSRRHRVVRWVASAALLANFGLMAYTQSLWSGDMRRAIADAALVPVEQGKVGIVVSPSDQGPQAFAEIRAIENEIKATIKLNGLASDIIVRRAYPVYSEEQARRLGHRLKAHIIVWKSERARDRVTPGYHVTVLGANEKNIELQPVSLMLFMVTQDTFTIGSAEASAEGDTSPSVSRVVASVAVGFGAQTAGQPLVAAGLFQNVLDSSASVLSADALRMLRNDLGTAFFYCGRADLANKEYESARSAEPDARSWIGTGIVYMDRREWQNAMEAFNRALSLDPYNAIPYCAFGIAAARERNVGRAISAYEQAIALRPDWGAPYALVGLTYELEANIGAARQAYQNCALYAGPNLALRDLALRRAEEIQRNPPTPVPTATPLPTPTPLPIPTSAIYRVQKGDTLRAIAIQFGVSMESIMELNKLDDPNTVMVGQYLLIPRKP